MTLNDYIIWCFTPARPKPRFKAWQVALVAFAVLIALMTVFASFSRAEEVGSSEIWKVTAYCSCFQCCGKTDGIMANGHKVFYGAVACNWLKFGTRLRIEGLGEFVVCDRGAKSLFGSKSNHIRHLDIYMPTHQQARQFGVKWLEVTILKKGG